MRLAAACFAAGLSGLACAARLPAQELRGRVVAEAGSAPIEGATVSLRGSNGRVRATAVTDDRGAFAIRAGRAGTWTLDVQRIGFAAWKSDPFDVGDTDEFELEIRLGVDAVPLEPVRVVASAPGPGAEFRRRMVTRGGTGRFIGRAEIGQATSARTSDLLRNVPGLTLEPVLDPRLPGSGAARYRVTGRGGCPAALFLDGLPVRQTDLMTVDDLTDPRTLEGLEIYTSSAMAPAQYRSDGECGVVLFWSRPPSADASTWSWKRLGFAAAAIGFMVALAR